MSVWVRLANQQTESEVKKGINLHLLSFEGYEIHSTTFPTLVSRRWPGSDREATREWGREVKGEVMMLTMMVMMMVIKVMTKGTIPLSKRGVSALCFTFFASHPAYRGCYTVDPDPDVHLLMLKQSPDTCKNVSSQQSSSA